jgi:hypothetical protein
MAWCGGLRADHGQKHDPGDEISFRGDLTNEGPLQKQLLWQIFAIDGRNWIPESDFQ